MPIIPGAASVTNQNISANTKGALRHCQSWCTTFFASQHSVRGVSIMGPYLDNRQHNLIWRKVVCYVVNRSFQRVKGGSYSPQLAGESDRASLQDQLLHPQHVPNKLRCTVHVLCSETRCSYSARLQWVFRLGVSTVMYR